MALYREIYMQLTNNKKTIYSGHSIQFRGYLLSIQVHFLQIRFMALDPFA